MLLLVVSILLTGWQYCLDHECAEPTDPLARPASTAARHVFHLSILQSLSGQTGDREKPCGADGGPSLEDDRSSGAGHRGERPYHTRPPEQGSHLRVGDREV